MDTSHQQDVCCAYAGLERLFESCFDAFCTNVVPSSSEKVAMYAAIATNNRAKVVDMLEDGFPVNDSLSFTGSGLCVTALHAAIIYGREEIAESLLSFGADANKPREDGFTPAKLVYHFGDVGLLHGIIRHGGLVYKADVLPSRACGTRVSGTKIDDEAKSDPKIARNAVKRGRRNREFELHRLFQAIRDNDEALVQQKVNDPTLMEITDCFGRPAIAYAAMLGRIKLVRWMLSSDSKYKLSLAASSPHAVSALQWAVLRGHTDTATLIMLQGAQRCGLTNPEYMAKMLYSAVLSNNLLILQCLLNTCGNGPGDFSTDLLWPAIREAISFSSTDIFNELLGFFREKLLTAGISTSQCPQSSILAHAIDRCRLPIIEALLDMGAPADEILPDGSSPLQKALTVAEPTIVRQLLSHGAIKSIHDDEKVAKFVKRATTPALRPTSKERKCAKLLLSTGSKSKSILKSLASAI